MKNPQKQSPTEMPHATPAVSAAPLAFHPNDQSFNRANALYLAHASDVAYFRAPARAVRERLGLDALALRHKVTRTRAFLGICDTHAVLSFRGTDPVTLPNWVTDFVVKLIECREYEGRVHHGFSSALRSTWQQIEAALEEAKDRPLFITGHSLGGALAVLAGSRLAKTGRPPAAIYTFGAPRVGDLTFCAGYSLPTYRIVNRLDIVPEMPIPSVKHLLPKKVLSSNKKLLARLKQIAEQAPCYGHVNTLVYIDRNSAVIPAADVVPWRKDAVERAILTRGKSFLEGITDHLITNYIRSLEADVRAKARASEMGGADD